MKLTCRDDGDHSHFVRYIATFQCQNSAIPVSLLDVNWKTFFTHTQFAIWKTETFIES